ncbi:MAG: carbon-nitrogen hydrolase family protein [Planctomycetota bacterium]
MKLAIAQTRPKVGEIAHNLNRHLELAEQASSLDAQLVMFPELSVTGYEPKLALEYARHPSDDCFKDLQAFCDQRDISMGVGVPLPTDTLPRIATYLFRPRREPLIYSKVHLHRDELPYFQPGSDPPRLIVHEPPIAMAICYELSLTEHAEKAYQAGAAVYLASAAKTAEGVDEASVSLSQTASKYGMMTMLSNCLGLLDGVLCGGRSAVWGRHGKMVEQLGDQNEGIIVVDSET